jgi:predicted RecB family nuclease
VRRFGDYISYSATDLVNFLECEHLISLDLVNLDTPLPKAEEDEQNKIIQGKGVQHETAYLNKLETQFPSVAKIEGKDIHEQYLATTHALKQGANIIYQAVFLSGPFTGIADFLKRVGIPSDLGTYSYEVIDTKLARAAKAKFIIQLCFYSDMLAEIQGIMPRMMHVALGNGTEVNLKVADYFRYYKNVKERFLKFVAQKPQTYPEGCDHCGFCDWRNICEEQWIKDDHLNQVANISRLQIKRLNDVGIMTLKQLAELRRDAAIPKIIPETLHKLSSQALLQLNKREKGENIYEILPIEPGAIRGFMRLPVPDEGDIFFDMEGDPLEEGGLEYLFGVYYIEDNEPVFKEFWAHNRQEEREAFESFMDFVSSRLQKYPRMHIYHYAHYEETALKRLMSLHGVRESAVDNLLRNRKLVDLYKVVKEALRVSEPRYSIKNLETFYMKQRQGDVKSAGDSIVYYEKWRVLGDNSLLEKIRSYNEDDCRSLFLLRQWLLQLRPEALSWFSAEGQEGSGSDDAGQTEAEAMLLQYEKALLHNLPLDRSHWTAAEYLQEITFYLLEFHRRAAKPEWWEMFKRAEMSGEELLDDPECIAQLQLDTSKPPQTDKRSKVYFFTFPEQEFKMQPEDDCLCADTLQRLGTIKFIDEKASTIGIKISAKNPPPPKVLSIIPTGPISTKPLREALYRFADSVIGNDNQYMAAKALLMAQEPLINGRKRGAPIVMNEERLIDEAIEAILKLRESYVFIQGPPGAGKTYTGSHIIVELLRKGFTVGVSSNSHKAINNLLRAVEERATEKKFTFCGAKKSIDDPETQIQGKFIKDVFKNEAILNPDLRLIAGTAWLFCSSQRRFDYLFVDEAGQVSLANLVAMAMSAKNIVLIGDQMQLGQPIQGVHPGRSGESTLEYLLNGQATIEPGKGIFLPATWRMHEDICRFISEAVYDGRLIPQPINQEQCLILSLESHPDLRPSGIRFIGTEHDGCSQKSEEEAEIVKALYLSLLKQKHKDKKGIVSPMAMDNILVVAPYNMQVNYLKSVLPYGARVGTVDKFQGQEAEVVIISMTTSSREYLPRHIEFLYSKNRLNVAISRARCLTLLIANPALMAIKCTTVEQMQLVNTLCWVDEYSRKFD